MTYQWQKWTGAPFEDDGSWADLGGAGVNAATLNTATHGVGKYRCKVENAAGIAYSQPQSVFATWAQHLMDNVGGGLAIDFTPPEGMVKVVDPVTPANNFSGKLRDWVQNWSSASPKIVRHADGVWRYAPHNLALYSGDISQWIGSGANGAGITITATAGTSGHYISVGTPFGSDHEYTARVPIKAGTASLAYVSLIGASENFVTVVVNLSTGAVTETDLGSTAGTIISSSVTSAADDENFGAGWWFVDVTFSVTAASAARPLSVGIAPLATGNSFDSNGRLSWAASGTETIQIKRPQIVRGYEPTEYMETGVLPVFSPALHCDPVRGWGLLSERQTTNRARYSSDFTRSSVWTLTNMNAALTATGPDGVANSASTLTATAGNATVLQTVASGAGSSTPRWTQMWVKRRTGTGTIEMTQDNGSTWTAVTVTSDYTVVKLPRITSANNVVGIRIVTSGDEIDVAWFHHVLGSSEYACVSPIPTLGTVATRARDQIDKSATALPWSSSAGMLVVSAHTDTDSNGRLVSFGSDSSNKNMIYMASASIRPFMSVAGVNQLGGIMINSTVGSPFSVGISWEANDVFFTANEGAAVSGSPDTSASIPSVTHLTLGNELASNSNWDGLIFSLLWLPRVAANEAELNAIEVGMAA